MNARRVAGQTIGSLSAFTWRISSFVRLGDSPPPLVSERVSRRSAPTPRYPNSLHALFFLRSSSSRRFAASRASSSRRFSASFARRS